MTKSELIARLAERFPQLVAKDADFAVEMILDAMSEALVRGDFHAHRRVSRERRIHDECAGEDGGRTPQPCESVHGAASVAGVACGAAASSGGAVSTPTVRWFFWNTRAAAFCTSSRVTFS